MIQPCIEALKPLDENDLPVTPSLTFFMPPIITVENLGKSYLVGHQSAKPEGYVALRDVIAGGVKDLMRKTSDAFKGRQIVQGNVIEEFWALRDVSFEVGQGEVVGIIGRNGAGKSTLLKVLSRITEPTKGRVTLRGRAASLLEVGTGFHPELSGRENIFLNGAILGMTKQEIRSKFDEIVAFAEIDKFIDTPVKRYSSGMYVRLAFAVAAHLEPEILIVDEVLAVGDASFQKKCLGKMKEVSGQDGRTVLFVSHNMSAVQSLCSRGILLKNGQTAFIGDTEECVRQYLTAGGQIPTESKWIDMEKAPGNDKVRIMGIRAISKRTDEHAASLFDMATPLEIEIDVRVLTPCMFHTTLHFLSDQGITAFTSGGLPPRDIHQQTNPGEYRLVCRIPEHLLNQGGYSIRLLLVEDGTRPTTILEDVVGFDVKDLSHRGVGSFHGKEPGPVCPKLAWTVSSVD